MKLAEQFAKKNDGPFLSTFGLALLVGLIAGSLGAAFHYFLDQALAVHTAIAANFADQVAAQVAIAALFGAAMAGVAFMLVRVVAPEAAGSGIQEIEGAMAGLRPVRAIRVLLVKFIGGILGIGAGLVLGREGPTVHMGGCIGKMVGESAKASPGTMNTLLAAGAAAGLSAAFGAPFASILFVMEEMRGRFNYSFVSIHAVAIASLTAKVMDDQVFGVGPLLPIQLKISMAEIVLFPAEVFRFIPFFIGLGILIGLCGVAFNATLMACLRYLDRFSMRTMSLITITLGGISGALVLMAPGCVGGGDKLVQAVFSDHHAELRVLLALFLVRGAMTFLSYGSGLPGGIFAPMLAIGAIVGMGFGTVSHLVLPDLEMPAGAFALAAMAGLFAATVRAPLTGIVLVAELTASFELLAPLVITCVISSITAQALNCEPIYDSLLERTLRRQAKMEEAAQEESELQHDAINA